MKKLDMRVIMNEGHGVINEDGYQNHAQNQKLEIIRNKLGESYNEYNKDDYELLSLFLVDQIDTITKKCLESLCEKLLIIKMIFDSDTSLMFSNINFLTIEKNVLLFINQIKNKYFPAGIRQPRIGAYDFNEIVLMKLYCDYGIINTKDKKVRCRIIEDFLKIQIITKSVADKNNSPWDKKYPFFETLYQNRDMLNSFPDLKNQLILIYFLLRHYNTGDTKNPFITQLISIIEHTSGENNSCLNSLMTICLIVNIVMVIIFNIINKKLKKINRINLLNIQFIIVIFLTASYMGFVLYLNNNMINAVEKHQLSSDIINESKNIIQQVINDHRGSEEEYISRLGGEAAIIKIIKMTLTKRTVIQHIKGQNFINENNKDEFGLLKHLSKEKALPKILTVDDIYVLMGCLVIAFVIVTMVAFFL